MFGLHNLYLPKEDKYFDLCPICLIGLNPSKKIIQTTKCNHCYHKSCLEEYKYYNNVCPICRKPITNPYEEFRKVIEGYNDFYRHRLLNLMTLELFLLLP